ncbi:MAG: FimB/Mfa2 family fimbrial subunit [Odoribacteraceae bacterium]|nr:FimB/Mfa2 family fimbrial subunit [Odoribacteraceae bacterium]
MKRFDRKKVLIAALALLAGACVVNVEESAPLPGDGQHLVTLALSVPGPPASRALTVPQEDEVKTVDVLLFTADGSDKFHYRAVGSNIADDGTPSNKKKFNVKLPGGTWNVVVLANARESFVNAAYAYKDVLVPATPATTDVSRANALNGLVMQFSTGQEWTENNFHGIPMWGYKNGVVIDPESSSSAPVANVTLTRAVARVNITLYEAEDEEEEDAADVFEMTHVYLYNYSRAGSVAPTAVALPAGYDGDEWNGEDLVAVAPRLPGLGLLVDNITKLRVLEPLEYEVDDAEKSAFVQGIYTFEAAKGSGTDLELPENTCLVIGGRYRGGPALTYYRVDFIDKQEKYLPLLRNHSYNVEIQEVTDAGYPTKEDAFANKPANIKAEVLDWNEKTLPNIVFDGVNYLAASQTEFLLQGIARTGNRFTVKSSVAWTSSVTFEGNAEPWITGLLGSFSGAGNVDEVIFNVTRNESGGDRAGYIHITAGRLDFVVTVTQRYAVDVDVWVTEVSGAPNISTLAFSSASGEQPEARMFLLNWYPVDAAITASITGDFAFDDNSDKPGTPGNTTIVTPAGADRMVLTIRPKALTGAEVTNTPFLSRGSTVTFTATANASTETATLALGHDNYYITSSSATYALSNATVHSFTVKSNTPWKITSVVDDDGILDPAYAASLVGVEGGPNTGTGVPVSFKLVANETLDGKIATLTLVDPTGRAAPATVIIKGMVCGLDATPVIKHIGNNDYMTHMYGGKCWMVQNSMEGTWIAKGYGLNAAGESDGHEVQNATRGSLNGYYYESGQAATACPEGWHLPNTAEFSDLVTEVNATPNTIGKWWRNPNGASNGAFAGDYHYANGGLWRHWGMVGYWWGNGTAANGTTTLSIDPYPPTYCSVRCVQE